MAWIVCLNRQIKYRVRQTGGDYAPRDFSWLAIELITDSKKEGAKALHQDIHTGGLIDGLNKLWSETRLSRIHGHLMDSNYVPH